MLGESIDALGRRNSELVVRVGFEAGLLVLTLLPSQFYQILPERMGTNKTSTKV